MAQQGRTPRIYSRRGDLGETSLTYGPRVGKDHYRIVALGSLDELNAWLGVARTHELDTDVECAVLRLQVRLFDFGEEVASIDPGRQGIKRICDSDVKALERVIDLWNIKLPPTRGFVVPGGSAGAATLHMARAVCRRAERRITALLRFDPTFSPRALAWLNRVGDLLFLLARFENQRLGVEDRLSTIRLSLDKDAADLF